VLSTSVTQPSLWPNATLENCKAAAPISSPDANVEKRFMKKSSLPVLVGRNLSPPRAG